MFAGQDASQQPHTVIGPLLGAGCSSTAQEGSATRLLHHASTRAGLAVLKFCQERSSWEQLPGLLKELQQRGVLSRLARLAGQQMQQMEQGQEKAQAQQEQQEEQQVAEQPPPQLLPPPPPQQPLQEQLQVQVQEAQSGVQQEEPQPQQRSSSERQAHHADSGIEPGVRPQEEQQQQPMQPMQQQMREQKRMPLEQQPGNGGWQPLPAAAAPEPAEAHAPACSDPAGPQLSGSLNLGPHHQWQQQSEDSLLAAAAAAAASSGAQGPQLSELLDFRPTAQWQEAPDSLLAEPQLSVPQLPVPAPLDGGVEEEERQQPPVGAAAAAPVVEAEAANAEAEADAEAEAEAAGGAEAAAAGAEAEAEGAAAAAETGAETVDMIQEGEEQQAVQELAAAAAAAAADAGPLSRGPGRALRPAAARRPPAWRQLSDRSAPTSSSQSRGACSGGGGNDDTDSPRSSGGTDSGGSHASGTAGGSIDSGGRGQALSGQGGERQVQLYLTRRAWHRPRAANMTAAAAAAVEACGEWSKPISAACLAQQKGIYIPGGRVGFGWRGLPACYKPIHFASPHLAPAQMTLPYLSKIRCYRPVGGHLFPGNQPAHDPGSR